MFPGDTASRSHRPKPRLVALVCLGLTLVACGDDAPPIDAHRRDTATQVAVDLEGSLQNPAWSPDGEALVFTRFRRRYNAEPADLFIVSLADGSARVLVSDGSGNVNLPGAAWSAVTDEIVFSSSREPHDEIYRIPATGAPGDEVRITARTGDVAYEPSLSPDARWVVFESHLLDQEGHGVITKLRVDGAGSAVALTDPTADCRQPNWSPDGSKILYQRHAGGRWEIWTMNDDGSGAAQVTDGPGDKTDAAFSPDGAWIVYSSDSGELDLANLFIIPASGGAAVRATDWDGYDGAPSWSPDGRRLAFESYPGDPDGGPGTTLWVVDVPPL